MDDGAYAVLPTIVSKISRQGDTVKRVQHTILELDCHRLVGTFHEKPIELNPRQSRPF